MNTSQKAKAWVDDTNENFCYPKGSLTGELVDGAKQHITALLAERKALLDALIDTRDDLSRRAEDGVVAIGNGVWNKLNEAIQLCEESI